MGIETFKLTGAGAHDNAARIIEKLAEIGVTATESGGVFTITIADLAGAGVMTRKMPEILRLCDAKNLNLTYAVSV